MQIIELFTTPAVPGIRIPDNNTMRAWIAWAATMGADIERAIDSCPHPGARVILVSAIALRSHDAELLRWQATQLGSLVAAYNAGAEISPDDIMPVPPRDLIVRAFQRL